MQIRHLISLPQFFELSPKPQERLVDGIHLMTQLKGDWQDGKYYKGKIKLSDRVIYFFV